MNGFSLLMSTRREQKTTNIVYTHSNMINITSCYMMNTYDTNINAVDSNNEDEQSSQTFINLGCTNNHCTVTCMYQQFKRKDLKKIKYLKQIFHHYTPRTQIFTKITDSFYKFYLLHLLYIHASICTHT